MANVIINDTHLTNIADAIREKTGTSDTYKPGEMATAIQAIPQEGGGGGGYEPTDEDLTYNTEYNFLFGHNNNLWILKNYANRTYIKPTSSSNYLFALSDGLTSLKGVRINSTSPYITDWFLGCQNLIELPTVEYAGNMIRWNNMFRDCSRLREVSDEFFINFNWDFPDSITSATGTKNDGTYYGCYSLRKASMIPLAHGTQKATNAIYLPYKSTFYKCYVLDEIVDLPIRSTANITANLFSDTFTNCYRLKNMTFATQEDGTPYTVNWKSQTIDLRTVGFAPLSSIITTYNSGITPDKEVKEYSDYLALKDDPDWFSCDKFYSRYTRSSAVATINSLPDTSAYLAANGGTNTITFEKYAGSMINGVEGANIDGGEEAINKLTEAEIAVATAKGWTVSLV